MYPVQFEAQYVEERRRLTTFFRFFLALPLDIWGLIYAIGTFFVVIASWFYLVFTGTYHPGMYDFISQYLRFRMRASSYRNLLTDQYPPFHGRDDDPNYPIKINLSGTHPTYQRILVFYRPELFGVLAYIVAGVWIARLAVVFCSWWVIVFTGRQRRDFQDAAAGFTRYNTQARGYRWFFTETYPPLHDRFEPEAEGTQETLPTSTNAGRIEPLS